MASKKINPNDIAREVHGEDKYINGGEMEWMLLQYNDTVDEPVNMDTFIDKMEQDGE